MNLIIKRHFITFMSAGIASKSTKFRLIVLFELLHLIKYMSAYVKMHLSFSNIIKIKTSY